MHQNDILAKIILLLGRSADRVWNSAVAAVMAVYVGVCVAMGKSPLRTKTGEESHTFRAPKLPSRGAPATSRAGASRVLPDITTLGDIYNDKVTIMHQNEWLVLEDVIEGFTEAIEDTVGEVITDAETLNDGDYLASDTVTEIRSTCEKIVNHMLSLPKLECVTDTTYSRSDLLGRALWVTANGHSDNLWTGVWVSDWKFVDDSTETVMKSFCDYLKQYAKCVYVGNDKLVYLR